MVLKRAFFVERTLAPLPSPQFEGLSLRCKTRQKGCACGWQWRRCMEAAGVTMKRYLVTGGAGFIGSAVVRKLIRDTSHQVLVVDKLTYAGNLDSLTPVANSTALPLRAGRYRRRRADARDSSMRTSRTSSCISPRRAMSIARSTGRERSSQTNVVGTFALLQAALHYWRRLARERQRAFRFHHISTDEVFGSLGEDGLLPRGISLSAELALFGLEGRLGPFRPSLAPYLRPADDRHQLLEQLWALSLSREADPADHPQCARGQTPAGLRQGRERARLALRRRSRRRRCILVADQAGSRARLQHRRPQRADQYRRRARDLRARR